jgi:hypothetical protein
MIFGWNGRAAYYLGDRESGPGRAPHFLLGPKPCTARAGNTIPPKVSDKNTEGKPIKAAIARSNILAPGTHSEGVRY